MHVPTRKERPKYSASRPYSEVRVGSRSTGLRPSQKTESLSWIRNRTELSFPNASRSCWIVHLGLILGRYPRSDNRLGFLAFGNGREYAVAGSDEY